MLLCSDGRTFHKPAFSEALSTEGAMTYAEEGQKLFQGVLSERKTGGLVLRTSSVARIPRLDFLGAMPQTPARPHILRRCINKVSLPVKFLFHLI